MESEFEFTVIRHNDVSEVWSQELKVVFLLKGRGWLRTENSDTVYTVSGEDIFVVNSFQMHSIVLEEASLAIALQIAPSFLALLSPETGNPCFNCKSFLFREERQQPFTVLRQDFAKAFRAWYKKESEYSIFLRSKVVMVAADLFRYFYQEESSSGKESGRERLRSAVNYIQSNYRENITLSDLAEHTYLSNSYISRSFQKYMKVSFTGYLTQVRLLHAAAMLKSEKTITEIAYESGFSSASALIDAFKHHNGITPGQYRRNLGAFNYGGSIPGPIEEGFSSAFVSLMKYAEPYNVACPMPTAHACEITANIGTAGRRLFHRWKYMVNAGYAKDVLDASLQDQITKLQETVGFRYIRCKGFLDDDMMLYTKDLFGKITVNYVYVDQVIDFILSVNAKPMLEFGHMPSALAQNGSQLFRRPVFLSLPTDLESWHCLILGLLQHLTGRYGMEEMREWLYQPWISVELAGYTGITLEEYMQVYAVSSRTIKGVCRDFMTCGPGSTVNSTKTLRSFLKQSGERCCMPDILSLRSFSSIDPEEEESGLKLAESNETFHMAVSGDEDYLPHSLLKIQKETEQAGIPEIPIMLDEWSNNVWQRDLCNDTSYKSAYLFKNIMDSHDSYFGMGYFNISDRLEEIAPAAELFHGGFGLFTRNGIPKSAFRAMQLFNKAGDRFISGGNGYFITSSDKEVQIFLHNYCHYDMLYRYRNTTNLSCTERYKVFIEKLPKSFHIHLEGLAPGRHVVRRYGIGPQGGSTYDAWIAMGAPEPMTREEEKRLRELSEPIYHTGVQESENFLTVKAWLQPHEVQLIIISL